ncbi:MAG: FimB/Mfa2 family fimbrial subunit [Bacteroidales bacterium]|nr:FimB/Mfa2 family fimbrial subunit [Bacteroidales bacterium]
MKYIKILSLIVVAMALNSCIKEDMSDCPPVVSFTFSYNGDTNDPSMFAKYIDNVTLFCYDEAGELVKTHTVNKSDLALFQGAKLSLYPGNYTIAAWGNITEGTTEVIGNVLGTSRVRHPDFGKGTNIPGNDHLYYGRYNVSIPETKAEVAGDIPFKGAHINVEVYVSGVGFANDQTSWASVEMTSLMPEYTMMMDNAQPFATTYYPVTTWSSEPNVSQSIFQTLRFEDDNEIEIKIKNQGGTLLASAMLKDFIKDNPIYSVNGKNEATVRIEFKFYDGKFEITIPDWGEQPIEPNI